MSVWKTEMLMGWSGFVSTPQQDDMIAFSAQFEGTDGRTYPGNTSHASVRSSFWLLRRTLLRQDLYTEIDRASDNLSRTGRGFAGPMGRREPMPMMGRAPRQYGEFGALMPVDSASRPCES